MPSRKLESFCRSDDYASWRNCERKFFAVAYEKTASLIVCHFWHPNILVRPFEDCVRANLPPIACVIIICHQNSSGIHIAVSGARKETPRNDRARTPAPGRRGSEVHHAENRNKGDHRGPHRSHGPAARFDSVWLVFGNRASSRR